MKIRYCPCCVELVHFEEAGPTQQCWNCGRVTNFSLLQTPEQRLSSWLVRQLEATIQEALPSYLRFAGVGKTALVVALPIAVLMLLISNSLDVHGVHNLADSFLLP